MLALAGSLAMAGSALAATTVTTFDDFWSDALYASWADPATVINAGPTSYAITATGYGSNYRYLGLISAPGETTVELTVTLSGPPAADGHLGPIVSLVDGDGTYLNYAWWGQPLGTHTLTMPLATPSWVGAAGTTPGLDLTNILHLHMQLDPGGFGTTGAYTVTWENLRLIGRSIQITTYAFNPATKEFTLTWSSVEGKYYTVLHSATANGTFTALVVDVPSGGTTTTATATMPAGNAGFLRIEEVPLPF